MLFWPLLCSCADFSAVRAPRHVQPVELRDPAPRHCRVEVPIAASQPSQAAKPATPPRPAAAVPAAGAVPTITPAAAPTAPTAPAAGPARYYH